MRFTVPKKNINEGAIRVRHGFLIFPKLIKREIRWLERTAWKEEYIIIADHYGYGIELKFWRPTNPAL